MSFKLKKLGPGLMFAGAAIGVSHLVQSTRAGADFGFGLLWALFFINIIKYPFFQFGPKYTSATGESLLDGYHKLGKPILWIYFLLNLATMFTIQTAVTIVTAGLASTLFGFNLPIEWWAFIVLGICFFILLNGKYSFLDHLMKVIVITLTLSTIIAVIIAIPNTDQPLSFEQIIPSDTLAISFLIAFMGWMPAPLDVSIWQSLWTLEKKKLNPELSQKSTLFDFNIGFMSTILVGCCFLALGALVMNHSGETFSPQASSFANQLITLYTQTLGNWTYFIIALAAFTTMFSTTLTTLDASPRAMSKSVELLFNKNYNQGYFYWMVGLAIGTLIIFIFFLSEMAMLVKIATILSFLTAPFYAVVNYILITSKHTPKELRPKKGMRLYSIISILLLISFSIWYLTTV